MGQTWGSMSYIKEIALKNYRSFVDARCRLSPFTLIVGANNAGKSNLLKAVRDVASDNRDEQDGEYMNGILHHAVSREAKPYVSMVWSDEKRTSTSFLKDPFKSEARVRGIIDNVQTGNIRRLLHHIPVAQFDPLSIGNPEGVDSSPFLQPNGAGVSWILDKWNSGAKAGRERFAQVVTDLRRCVPEIEALSFYDVAGAKRGVQVEQFGLPNPVPLSEVSDGTRLVLAILTLINLEEPPPVILLEDINRGLHPRLYERIVEFLRTIANEGKTQILATTHDPYLIDEFRDNPEAVVIVEKKDAASTLTNLDEKLKALQGDDEPLDMPLGELWFSGSLGGVPRMKLPEILKPQLK